MKKINLIFILLLLVGAVYGKLPDEIHVVFEESDTKTLKAASETFENAKTNIKAAIELFKSIPEDADFDLPENQVNYIKAFKDIQEASDTYNNATHEVYNIYHKGCDDFWKNQTKDNHYATGLEKAKYMQNEAVRMLDDADYFRAKIRNTGDFYEIIKYLNEATILEIQALRYEGRSLNIYQDHPVEYDYQWENDIDIEFILAQKEKERKERNEKLFGKKVEKEPEPEKEKEPEPVVVEKPKVEPVVYRIQIAANYDPMEPEDLKRIYSGKMDVDEVQEDEWYKYQMGKYDKFSEAVEILEKLKISKSFIVAYQGGKKISIRQARKIAP